MQDSRKVNLSFLHIYQKINSLFAVVLIIKDLLNVKDSLDYLIINLINLRYYLTLIIKNKRVFLILFHHHINN